MTVSLTGIDVFVAVVDTGNFALAAQRLQLTRSAVAKSVARLEARLGARLFHRTTRSQRLTDEGQLYFESCRRALEELDAAGAALEAGRHGARGRLRVTMPAAVGRACIAPLLLELGQQHPELHLDLSFNDRRVDLVEEAVDLALRGGPLEDSDRLLTRLLGHQWMGVYASAGYLAERGRPADLAALACERDTHSFLAYGRQGRAQPWLFHDAQGQVLPLEVPARVLCDSLEVMLQAAMQDLGLVRLPMWLAADAVAAGRLLRVFDEARPYGYPLNAVWPQARTQPLKLRIVIDLLAQRLPALLALPQACAPG